VHLEVGEVGVVGVVEVDGEHREGGVSREGEDG